MFDIEISETSFKANGEYDFHVNQNSNYVTENT